MSAGPAAPPRAGGSASSLLLIPPGPLAARPPGSAALWPGRRGGPRSHSPAAARAAGPRVRAGRGGSPGRGPERPFAGPVPLGCGASLTAGRAAGTGPALGPLSQGKTGWSGPGDEKQSEFWKPQLVPPILACSRLRHSGLECGSSPSPGAPLRNRPKASTARQYQVYVRR